MRLVLTVLVLSSVALAGCGKPTGKPDPTKPIPWLVPPKDPKSSASGAAIGPGGLGSPAEELAAPGGEARVKHRPSGAASGAGACGVPRGYAKVDLGDALASPGAFAGQKIQVAGWLGARWSFVAPAVEGVPVCQAHATYSLGESESEGFLLDAPEERLDLRGPETVKVGATCASADVPDAEVAAAWGTVSPAGDEVWIDGICDADALPCKTAKQCPGVMACGAAGVCELL